jgi:hypothetical protein
MIAIAAALSISGVLWALLAAVVVYLVGLALVRLGVPAPMPVIGLVVLLVFLLVLLGNLNVIR